MNLADPLRLLLEHGLQSNQYTDQPTACIPMWSNVGCADDGKDCGAWKVIMHYYRLKVCVWCMCVCICVCMCVCICVHVCVCMCVYVYVCVCCVCMLHSCLYLD